MPNRDLIASLQRQIETERSKCLLAALLEQAVVQLRSEILRLTAEQVALSLGPR